MDTNSQRICRLGLLNIRSELSISYIAEIYLVDIGLLEIILGSV